jgi:PHS family inorganic phosphate transporter-like MFS transporter
VNALSTRDDDSVSSNDSMRYGTSMNLIALSVGIPAQVIFIYLLQQKGTKLIQVVGFFLNALAFFLLAGLYTYLLHRNADALFALYCFLMFNLCGGTNISTFVLPAQTYDKRIRATFNGISAALGKLGKEIIALYW